MEENKNSPPSTDDSQQQEQQLNTLYRQHSIHHGKSREIQLPAAVYLQKGKIRAIWSIPFFT